MLISANRLILVLALLALTACQSASKKEPIASTTTTPASAETQLPTDSSQRNYEQAIAALKDGDAKRALGLLQQVSADAPEKPYVFTNLGLAHFNLEQLDLAEIAFLEAIVRDSDDAVAHNHLGILQRRKGQFEAARKSYLRAIDIDSDYALAHLNLGILFDIYLQDLDRALQHYQKYQKMLQQEDSQVARWIIDIQRRLKSATASS